MSLVLAYFLTIHIANALTYTAKPAKCVVFHSQHKAAGAEIELKLWRYPLQASGLTSDLWSRCQDCKLICDRETWDCEAQTCSKLLHYTPRNDYRVAYRGYVQTLAGSATWGNAGDGRCIWATVSREPVSRLMSAYFYCLRIRPKDPLCGANRLNASTASIHDFAKHWGNFLFREFLWFPQLRALAESRADFNHTKRCDRQGLESGWNDPWVQYKDQLNGGDDPRTKSGAKNLKAVKEHLLGENGASPLYDVYGVLEEWNETLEMFDERIQLSDGHSWLRYFANYQGTHGSGHYSDEKDRALDDARKDPIVLAELAGDIDLYNNVIVPMFHRSRNIPDARQFS